jgi:glycosyltransferase involved in cell wall biosynthesis
MTIAYILNDYGGATPTTFVLRRALLGADGSDENSIWVRQRRSWKDPGRTSWNEVPCYSVGLPGAGRLGRRIAALQMARLFRRHRVRLVHLHWSGVDHWGFSDFRRLNPGLPYILTFHAFNARRLERQGLLDVPVLKNLLAGARRVSAVSAALEGEILELCPEAARKTQVVPNGVEPAPDEDHAPPDLPEDFILSVGMFCSLKGSDLLLFALFDLWREGTLRTPLVLCGQDAPRGQLRRLIDAMKLQDRVILLPDCPHEVVLSLMKRCLFFVSASREESFGMAIMEALAEGKAVIAPRIGGVPEFVSHEENGLLFQPGDVGALKESVLRLTGDASLRLRLGGAAAKTAERFQWSRTRQTYRRMHEEVLNGSR